MEAHKTVSIEELLQHCFQSDKDLLDKYHIEAPSDLDKCVKRTFDDLASCKDITIYRLCDNNETVGYFGIENYDGQYLLTGFMLNVGYREEAYKKEFWRIINDTMKKHTDEYFCGVYQKNERAVNFLERSGGENYLKIHDSKGNKTVFFKFKI